jgi:hypothetical protein
MRSDAVLADRRQLVRDAAREWFQAGWIDERALRSVEQMYPDDRARTGIAFRILFFVLTLAAIGGLLGAVYSQIDHPETVAVFALAAGAACWVATEHLLSSAKRRQGGIEAAFSVAAVVNLMIGPTILLLRSHSLQNRPTIIVLLFLFALIAGAAAWMWGYWPHTVFSAVSAFFAVISMPHGRVLWLIAVAVAYRWLVAGCDSAQLPPSRRKCFAAFLTVALLALYAGINVFLLDRNSFDWFHRSDAFPHWLSIGLTAVLPCLVFWIGILRRRRLFIVLGFGLGLFSLATLRVYVHVAPAWAMLTGFGILLLACAGILHRFLDTGKEGERAGFTALPLTGQPERHRAMEILASVSALTPDASHEVDKPGFRGGGGEFGGGGSSGNF